MYNFICQYINEQYYLRIGLYGLYYTDCTYLGLHDYSESS